MIINLDEGEYPIGDFEIEFAYTTITMIMIMITIMIIIIIIIIIIIRTLLDNTVTGISSSFHFVKKRHVNHNV